MSERRTGILPKAAGWRSDDPGFRASHGTGYCRRQT